MHLVDQRRHAASLSPSPLLSVQPVEYLEHLLLVRPAQHKALLVFTLEVAVDGYPCGLQRTFEFSNAPAFKVGDALVLLAQMDSVGLRARRRNSALSTSRVLAQPLIIFLYPGLLIIELNKHRLRFSEALQ